MENYIEYDSYHEEAASDMVYDDEMAGWEEAFLQGWHEAGEI